MPNKYLKFPVLEFLRWRDQILPLGDLEVGLVTNEVGVGPHEAECPGPCGATGREMKFPEVGAKETNREWLQVDRIGMPDEVEAGVFSNRDGASLTKVNVESIDV
jgi:hypothetical protein